MATSAISEKASQLYTAMVQLQSEQHRGQNFEVGLRQQQRHLKEIGYQLPISDFYMLR